MVWWAVPPGPLTVDRRVGSVVARATSQTFPLRVIPLRPLWGSLLVNTGVQAALLWVVVCFPRSLTRAIRLRRGLCAACGYPAGTAAVCSECGAELPGGARPRMPARFGRPAQPPVPGGTSPDAAGNA
jgi:hypothetical protein